MLPGGASSGKFPWDKQPPLHRFPEHVDVAWGKRQLRRRLLDRQCLEHVPRMSYRLGKVLASESKKAPMT